MNSKFPLKQEPTKYLDIIKKEIPHCYNDILQFVNGVEINGMPCLTYKEIGDSFRVIPEKLAEDFEDFLFDSKREKCVYLRGRSYYLNIHETPLLEEDAFNFLKDGLFKITNLYPHIIDLAPKAKNIFERMLVASAMDHHKNYSLILFTGLYQSMGENEKIDEIYFTKVLELVSQTINNYYCYIIKGKQPKLPLCKEDLKQILSKINPKAYNKQRYLGREFDHPGRIILYSSHLISEILKRNEKYHLGVDPLNGSAEMGLAINTIDKILNKNVIEDVDFLRYSTKDEKHPDIETLDQLLDIAVPKQLHSSFKEKIKDKNIIIIDENISEGGTLYNVRKGLENIAKKVDITVAEINYDPDNPDKIYLREDNLDYPPIGEWRIQSEIIRNIRELFGLISLNKT